jgi:HD-GYP domain-containing protein (c-di-GMP phosphodiesterase class II)
VSVLALPLHDRKGGILGVLQCLNKRGADGTFVPFDASDEEFLAALGGLAAAFLENAKLYRELDLLLEAVVSAFSRAIDDRDPCTSGHTRRVTRLSLNLARAVHACTDPPFDRVAYTRERFRQLRYAALLHDVGKIGVREHVLCKAEKLPAGGLENLRLRLELLRERRQTQVLERAATVRDAPAARLAAEFAPFAAQVERALELVTARNQPGFVTDAELAELAQLRDRGWITACEFECLAVRSGNLTRAELDDMRGHVSKSHEMLRQIPWPKELREVPEVAYSHHERPDGSGYPRGLQGDAIHLDGQVLAIADIYDALTATDRPYKKAVPHEKAQAMLLEDARKGRLLPELVRLFFEKECYRLREEL